MPLSAAWSRLQVLLPPITHHRSPVNCQPAVRAGTVDGGCQALPFNANNIRSTQLRSARACWQAGAVAVRLLGTPGVLWCSGAPRPKLGRRPKVDLGAQTDVVVPSRVFVLTLERCWHTVCQHRSREVLARANSTPGQVLAQSVLAAGSRGVRTHIGDKFLPT